MIAVLIAWVSLCGAADLGTEPTAFESSLVRARETGPLPAALGFAPERLAPFTPERSPKFYTEQWTAYANQLTRELYAGMMYSRQNFARAAHLESRRALSTLGLLNVLAQEACHAQPTECNRMLEAIVRHAAEAALALVPARTPEEIAKIRVVTEYLSARARSNHALGLATKAARTRWARSDQAAGQRSLQKGLFNLAAFLLAGAILTPQQSELTGVVALVALLAVMNAHRLLGDDFPLTSAFDWHRNHVAKAAERCGEFEVRRSFF